MSDPKKIRSWSYSRLLDFEACPLKAKLKIIDKIPEPERELPPGKTEHANDRGTRIHLECENFVKGQGPFPKEMKHFEAELKSVQARYKQGNVSLEGEWGFNKNWEPTDWMSAWLRVKLDVCIMLTPQHAAVVDYKGLPLDTPLPTPTGWTTMKEVQVGDKLFDRTGTLCVVTGKSTVKNLPCYKITFDDTSSVICDNEHLWTLADGSVKVVTELKRNDNIPLALPLQTDEQVLPLDPYVLGIWLADGKHTSGEICKPDEAIWAEIKKRGYEFSHNYNEGTDRCRTHSVYSIRGILNELGVLGDKSIPQNYLRASYQQRLDLLRGIMDGDGSANHKRKQVVLNTTRLDFAKQVQELLLSLGQRPLISPYKARGFGKEVDAFYVSFRPQNIQPFLLPRKAAKVLASWGAGDSGKRQVVNIEEVDSVPTQCIMVDSPDHTFLCTEKFIPTHNTGKRFGNEIKHGEQTQMYALATFLKYPLVEHVTAELWYPDVNDLATLDIVRPVGMRFLKPFDKRGRKMTEATEFPPNANAHSCRYCPYHPTRGSGDCQYGV